MQENDKNVITTAFEFDIKVKTFNKEKGELIDAIAAGAKLTKADAGRNQDIQEDWILVGIDQSQELGDQPKISIQTHSKLTKADSIRKV